MSKKKIKVIKRKDLIEKNHEEVAERPTSSETARKIVTNVSTWVNEFRQQRTAETKKAIETLLPNRPQNVSS